MSKGKRAGKAQQHKRPEGKRLGVKVEDGQKVDSGEILVRQRGTKFHAGGGVRVGRDHTLYALKSGTVTYENMMGNKKVSIK